MRRKRNVHTLLVLAVFLVDSCGLLLAVAADGPRVSRKAEKQNDKVQPTAGAGSKCWSAAQEEIRRSEYSVTIDPAITAISSWIGDSDQEDSWFGCSVSSAGDVNGDGFDDVIVGAYNYDNGQTNEGKVFMYYGSASGPSLSPVWTAESDQSEAYFGCSVSTAGDIDGDGYDDVIVGAYNYDNGQTNEGKVFVYHGSASGLSASPAWTAEGNRDWARFGYSVSTAGDINGDGFADVIVGAFDYDNGQSGEGAAFVYHGSTSGLSSKPAWTTESNQVNAELGYSVATAGDINGDGFSDVIIGAYRYDNGQTNEGRVFVYHGSAAGLSASPAWVKDGDKEGAWFGWSVATAGDINGDGFSDIIVGAPLYVNYQDQEGAAFVYLGSASGLSSSPSWMVESNQEFSWYGNSVSTAGDIDGDGFCDVIVGAVYYNNGQFAEGAAFVYHGSASGLSAGPDWTLEGEQNSAYFGRSVSTAGDINGDGISDIIIGADGYDNGRTNEGAAFVYYVNRAKYGGGSGTAEDPYLIYNAIQMNAIGANPGDFDKHFKLMADIDLSAFTGTEFNIIGWSPTEAFFGIFEGNGHVISNFSYSSDDFHIGSVGIFGYVNSPSALITDLVLIDPNIETEGLNIGSLIGYLRTGTVQNCYVKNGRISGSAQVGGLVGNIWQGSISNCGSINCNVNAPNGRIGGLVGGISSNPGPTMSNCFSEGGNVTGQSVAGGLLGVNSGVSISYCYSTTSVYATYQEGHYGIGGLVGYSQIGTISDCYATGDVQGYGTEIGGLVGYLHSSIVARCYSSGKISGFGTIGGLIGYKVGPSEVLACFWDTQTSGQNISDGGTGMTTDQMQTESTFMDAGWDFTTPIWKLCGWPSYPRLWWVDCPERLIYYVDADANGANNGSSWADAYNLLQDALAAAPYWSEIRVAQGTYKPGPLSPPPPPPSGGGSEPRFTVTIGDRMDAFEIKNGVAVKGGYAGFGELRPDARDIAAYETILSGDLNGNDIDVNDPCELLTDPCRAENSFHVVSFVNTYQNTILEGFTITGGNANGAAPNNSGGGMYNRYGNPSILHCNFIENSAAKGGGVHNHVGSPTLTNCKFIGNSAGNGGGLYNNKSSPMINKCIFSGNQTYEGGGIHSNNNSNPTLTNCILWDDEPNEIFEDALSTTTVSYSDVQGGWGGEGNIDADPCFADSNKGDYHLKSQAGRWNPKSRTWLQDNVTSPCIDGGDLSSDWSTELWPHGERINMGVYGGTAQASMSLSGAGNIVDLNFDRRTNYKDLKLITDKWLNEAFLLHEDLSRDGLINFIDIAILANKWCVPEPASNPNPADGVIIGNLDFDLSWTAGAHTASHDVYFGTSNQPPFILNQKATSFDPGTMNTGTKYYWRIDEVNHSGTTTGTVWSFLTMLPPPPPP